MDDIFFNSKEFKDNLSLYENSRKEGKVCILSSDELTDIADYYYMRGIMKDAVEAAEYAIKLYPDASSPLLFMARMMACSDKDPQKARGYLKKVTDADYADYFSVNAEACLLEENKDDALKWLCEGERALEDYEDRLDLFYDAAYMLVDYGFIEEARKWAEKIHEKDADDYIKLQARFLVDEGKYEQVIPVIESLIDKDPFFYEHWALLANVQLSCNRYSDALSSSEYAIAIDSQRPEAYMYQGNASLKLGNYDKAMEAFQKYTDGNGTDVGYMLQGRCQFYMQNNVEALRLLKTAEGKCPNDKYRQTDIYKELAVIYVWEGDTPNATHYIQKIKDLGMVDADLYIIEGGLMLNENKFEEATRIFLEGLPQAEMQHCYMLQVAVAYYEHRYDEAAYKMLQEVRRLAPDNYQWAAYLTACCFFLQKFDEFLENLEITVTKTPEDAKAVLSQLFPSNLEPYDYFKFAKERLDGKM